MISSSLAPSGQSDRGVGPGAGNRSRGDEAESAAQAKAKRPKQVPPFQLKWASFAIYFGGRHRRRSLLFICLLFWSPFPLPSSLAPASPTPAFPPSLQLQAWTSGHTALFNGVSRPPALSAPLLAVMALSIRLPRPVASPPLLPCAPEAPRLSRGGGLWQPAGPASLPLFTRALSAAPRRDRQRSSTELGGQHSAGPGRWVTAPLAGRGGNGALPQRPLIPRGPESIPAIIESEYPRACSRTWLFPSPRAGGPERRDTTGPGPRRERTASPNRLARSLSLSSPLSNLLCGLEKHRCRMVSLDKARRAPSSHSLDTQTPPPPPPRQCSAHGAPRALFPLPLVSSSDYSSKHWAAAPPREGVVWKSFKDSVTLGVDAQKPEPLPRWGRKCRDA